MPFWKNFEHRDSEALHYQNKTKQKKANNKSNKQTKTYFQFHSKHHKKIVHEVFVINIVPFYK